MSRHWFGTPASSASQAADRNQRAARRAISQLQQVTSDSDDDFRDANTSFSAKLNLDGDAEDLDQSIMTAEAAALAAEMAKPLDKRNYADDPEAWKKDIKIKFEIHDVKYWFNTVESQMKKFGINLQWSKKDAIVPLLLMFKN